MTRIPLGGAVGLDFQSSAYHSPTHVDILEGALVAFTLMDDGVTTFDNRPEITTHEVKSLEHELRLNATASKNRKMLTWHFLRCVALESIASTAVHFYTQRNIPLI